MADPTLIFLPGLHGTADLAGGFLEAVPPEIRRQIITYPTDKPLGYAELLERITEQVRDETSMVVIGESFSGPLAVMFAAANPQRVVGVVLVASFVRHPLPSWLRHFAPVIARLPLPCRVIRWILAGSRASDEFVGDVRQAIRQSTPAVLACRLRGALTVDCSNTLRQITAPMIYIRPTRDHLIGPASLEQIRSIKQDAAVVEIPGPHLILQTAPQAGWQAVKLFWSNSK